MPKTEKQKINAARERYAREFAGKLKARDETIRSLREENQSLKDRIARLEGELADGQTQREELEAQLKNLAKKAGMSADDLAAFREHMRNTARAADAMESLVGISRAIRGPYGL